jgi:hypothetical protein
LDTLRYQAELEQSRKEKERLQSHNQFLNHERNDESWQLKQSAKATKGKETRKAPRESSPRKAQPSNFGDGFDDDEIMVVSPSKSKSRVSTPKGGTKRKRDALGESPMKPLDLVHPVEPFSEAPVPSPIKSLKQELGTKKDDVHFRFLQQLLNRQISRDKRRTYEALSTFRFSSNENITLASLLMDQMVVLSVKQEFDDFPSAVGQIVLTIWSQCLEESHYEPLEYLLDLTQFILLEGATIVVSNLVDSIVDIVQRTADVNIIPRYKRFKRRIATDEPDNRTSNPLIDTQACLQLLDLTSTLCKQDQELLKRFWRSMRFDFISMLLRNSQEINDIILMVKILTTSIRTETFAMIVAPPASQSVSEQHVIDRLSSMLIETPRTAEGEHQYDAVEIASMRLEILYLIEAMCDKRYCVEGFARHPAALGRLVRVMHDELNALYDRKFGHEKRAELVNQATRLLYHITSVHSAVVGNLQEKLQTPPNSVYKHLIVLSRLAFSEGIFYEVGIDEDVLDAAHQMLEELVTPEEGEALQKAFVRESSKMQLTG